MEMDTEAGPRTNSISVGVSSESGNPSYESDMGTGSGKGTDISTSHVSWISSLDHSSMSDTTGSG